MGRISDTKTAVSRIINFIGNFTAASGFSSLVVGLSGGVDSSLSAVLGVSAIGNDNIVGLIMPHRSSSPDSEQDARLVAEKFGIRIEKIDISPMIDAYFGNREVSAIRKGNKMARERMSLLFDVAARENSLVLGTSNKTETCLGYTTWHGDAACSLNPLGGLYKREIRRMAEHLGIPSHIIKKNPTADLWPGQTDEEDLGISYDTADKVLFALIEEGERTLANLTETGADEKTIRSIVDRINRFAFKRSAPATDLLGGEMVPTRVVLS